MSDNAPDLVTLAAPVAAGRRPDFSRSTKEAPVTRIGNLINKALVDGRVNKSEVEGLIKEAEKNGVVSANEKKELANLLKRHIDKFDGESATRLASFLGEAAPKIVQPAKPTGPAPTVPVSDDPKVLNKHAGQITYNRIDGGQLFKDGVSFDDVVQGSIANCYFVGAVSAVAYSDPKLIEDAITDHGDGTFTVRFYERGPSGRYEPKLIRVDDDFPSYGPGSSPRYARRATRRSCGCRCSRRPMPRSRATSRPSATAATRPR
jgi:hypothetical protein